MTAWTVGPESSNWSSGTGAKTALIEPGSPWENGYVESFNGKLRNERLNKEVLNTLFEASMLIEQWRQRDNTRRAHSSLGYRPPAPDVIALGMLVPPGTPLPTGPPPLSATMLHQHFTRTTSWGLADVITDKEPGFQRPNLCPIIGCPHRKG